LVRLTAFLLLFAAAGGLAGAQPAPPAPWREAPEFRPLVAPAGPRGDAFRTFVSPLDLATVLAQIGTTPGLLSPPGAWQPRAVGALDAFGHAARVEPWKVARLFGARRAQVARGPRGADGHVTEAWTLISPYPDPAIERLQPGTLLIVLSLNRS
jgi:hypothetical protein